MISMPPAIHPSAFSFALAALPSLYDRPLERAYRQRGLAIAYRKNSLGDEH